MLVSWRSPKHFVVGWIPTPSVNGLTPKIVSTGLFHLLMVLLRCWLIIVNGCRSWTCTNLMVSSSWRRSLISICMTYYWNASGNELLMLVASGIGSCIHSVTPSYLICWHQETHLLMSHLLAGIGWMNSSKLMPNQLVAWSWLTGDGLLTDAPTFVDWLWQESHKHLGLVILRYIIIYSVCS